MKLCVRSDKYLIMALLSLNKQEISSTNNVRDN